MTYGKRTKITALILCALFCFVVFFSIAFVALEADHDCAGEDCPVCAEMAVCAAFIQTVATVAFVAALRPLLHFVAGRTTNRYASSDYSDTLVSLKVLLLN